jgi:flagellar protein FlgJ
MKTQDFVDKYKGFADMVEQSTGIPSVAILAQAALESGWGAKAVGNNLFGIKWKIGDVLSQRVVTTEYSDSEEKYVKFLSKVYDVDKGKWRFKVLQVFADYETVYDGFMAHAKLLLTDRYKGALKYKADPAKYLEQIWLAGYATDPLYAEKMADMVKSIQRRL